MKAQNPVQEAKFLAGTLVFALGLFVFSMTSILNDTSAGPMPSSRRSPASQTSINVVAANDLAQTSNHETITWDCKLSQDPAPEVDSTHVRLRSRFCEKSEPKAVLITNATNGYTAAVFLSAQGFSTDFIDLKEGLNTLSIQWKSAKGKDIQHQLKVFRKPASLAAPSEAVQDRGTN